MPAGKESGAGLLSHRLLDGLFTILGCTLRDRLRLPGLRLTARSSECIACGTCTRDCPMSLDVQSKVESGKTTATECILCARCADGCPENVVVLRFARAA